ncbi:low molecular weight phosphotyrosine protein phosphatase [Burkholderia sp. Ax-1719]|uniref:arsenate reductase/protein-tyrosine-phosphatase family protein n=1 Tax=Burkholderia sp. Ax-1719 TaxID=2608334 RepID=UPI0023DBF1AE|nr:low molecular weight phosphotyrosine protein phosphatase [Burkholderia sp. Ax-1719]
MFSNVIILCHANVCRSPMAEALFKQIFPSIRVTSAGFAVETGRLAAPFSVDAIKEWGIDISGHKATRITRNLVRDADLILTMSRKQVEDLHRMFPFSHGRVFRIGHFLDADIEDPVDCDFEKFRACRDLLEGAIARWSMYLGEEAIHFSSSKTGNGK